jgi:O6-methylguanine-DNA--protein-cysteine methyltransferase
MTLPKDILELREKRSHLEDEKHSLSEEKRKKKERLKALEQMMIVELNNANEKSRQDLSQLDSSIDELENRLEQVRQEAENQNDKSDQTTVQINDAAFQENVWEEAQTETFSESSAPSSENTEEKADKTNEKKKR